MASYFSRKLSVLVMLPFLVSLALVLAPSKALAATGVWVDMAHIKIGDDTYYDSNPYDTNLNYRLNGDNGDCVSEVSGFDTSSVLETDKLDQAELIVKSTASGGGCIPSPADPLTLGSTANALIMYNWVDAGQLQGVVSGRVWTVSPNDSSIFILNGGNLLDCNTYVTVTSNTAATTCVGIFDDFPVTLGSPSNRSLPSGTGTVNGNITGGVAGAVVPENCETSEVAGTDKLRWLTCGLIETLDKAIDELDDRVQGVLMIGDPTDSGTFQASQEMYNAWGRLRNIALIILIPMMLIMVIGTAMGVSFLDAYTVRRSMPRFLMAIIFISTSWYLTAFLINLTNTVGTGILGLMTQPFGGPHSTLSELITPTGASAVSWGGLAVFGGLILSGAVTLGIVLSYAFVGAIVLLLGWFLLVLRQLLILALVLFAPLAILSWVFPNNDALWKLWWGTFSKLLLMFPLIMMLMGAGKIFAYVVAAAR